MKALKKLSAILLALIMVLGLAVNAFAAGEEETPADPADPSGPATPTAQTYTITIAANDGSGVTTNHEYKVYQIFTGEVTEVTEGTTTKKILSNIRYGTAGLGTAGTEVPEAVLAAIGNDAEAYAKTIVNQVTTDYGTLTATNSWTLEKVPAGYYLIVDDTSKELTDGDAYSRYIVQVVKDVTMAPKSEKTSSDKKLYNDAVSEEVLNDAGVGTVVSYKLTAHIAENANSYDYYNFILADKLSGGLTFNDDIKVTIGGAAATEGTDYKVYKGDDGYTFEVALLEANKHANQDVVVTYSATLNSSAVAMVPNTNTYEVIYSNNPEHKYEGEQNQDKPGKPSNIGDEVFGKTPEKTTETFTTKLVLTKEDEQHNKLAGATFKLTSTNANQTVLNTKDYYELDNKTGTWYLLKDGTYTETAPTGTTYVKIGKGDSKTTEGYIKVGEDYIVPDDTKQYIDQDLYMLSLGTADQYASTNKYVKKTATTNASVSAPVEVILTTGADGVLNFEGLGTGDYVLKEVDAPDGYNYAADVTFTITFDAANKTFNVENVQNATITTDNGTFATTVVDKSGSVLPSTGGIGTTLFYVIGGILVAGAGVLLITKRRMNAAK